MFKVEYTRFGFLSHNKHGWETLVKEINGWEDMKMIGLTYSVAILMEQKIANNPKLDFWLSLRKCVEIMTASNAISGSQFQLLIELLAIYWYHGKSALFYYNLRCTPDAISAINATNNNQVYNASLLQLEG